MPDLKTALLIGAGALSLCLPAFINGAPLLFPDTLTYLLDGSSLVRFSWPSNERPVFYGLTIWFLHWERTVWPVVLAQGLVVAHLVWLTLRAAVGKPRGVPYLAIIAVLTVFTALSWYVSHLMPDVFSSVLILVLFLLGFCRDRLARGETIYLFLLATVSICFHLSNLAIAGALAAAGLVAWLAVRTWRPGIRLGTLAGPLFLALAAYFSFSLVVYRQITLTPKSPPFFLARLIADGPGRAYLEASCPQHSWAICRYLDRLHGDENQIIWAGLSQVRQTPDFWAIHDQEKEIVAGTVRMFPWQVARDLLSGTARQLIQIQSASDFDDNAARTLAAHYSYAGPGYPHSLQGEGRLTEAALLPVNILHGIVVVISIGACGPLLLACRRRHLSRPIVLLTIIVIGLLANAFITGGLSSVQGRYQGRVIWLLPFWAMLSAWGLSIVAAGRARPDDVAGRIVPAKPLP